MKLIQRHDPDFFKGGAAYKTALYAFAFSQCVWIGVGALHFDPVIRRMIPGLSFLIYVPLLLTLFGGAVLIGMVLQDVLADFFRQFHYGERFAFLLIHVLVFCIPIVLFMRFFLSFCLLSLNLFLALTLVNRQSFTRLYASNLFLMSMVILKQPGVSPIWILGGFLLIASCMSLDYFYFKASDYGESRGMPPIEFRRIAFKYVLPPVLLGIFLFWTLPPIFRQYRFQGIHLDIPASRLQLPPKELSRLVLNTVILTVLFMIGLALLYWLRKKLKGRKPPTVIRMKGVMTRVQKFVKEKILHPKGKKGMGPKDRLILEYNRFCMEMRDAGYPRESSRTPFEYSRMLEAPSGDLWETVEKITHIFQDVMYGNRDVEETDVVRFQGDVEKILGGFVEN